MTEAEEESFISLLALFSLTGHKEEVIALADWADEWIFGDLRQTGETIVLQKIAVCKDMKLMRLGFH